MSSDVNLKLHTFLQRSVWRVGSVPSEQLAFFVGETFHGSAKRDIEVRATETGTILIRVTTNGRTISDTSVIALTCEELERVNDIVNGVHTPDEPVPVEQNSAALAALASATKFLDGG